MTHSSNLGYSATAWLVILVCFNSLSQGRASSSNGVAWIYVPDTAEIGQTYTLKFGDTRGPASIDLLRGKPEIASGACCRDFIATLTTGVEIFYSWTVNNSDWSTDYPIEPGPDYSLGLRQASEKDGSGEYSPHFAIKAASTGSSGGAQSSTAVPYNVVATTSTATLAPTSSDTSTSSTSQSSPLNSSTSSPSSTSTPQKALLGLSIAAKAGLAFGVMTLIFLVTAGIFVLRKRKHKRSAALHHEDGDSWSLQEKKAFAVDQTEDLGNVQELDGIDVKQEWDDRSELHE